MNRFHRIPLILAAVGALALVGCSEGEGTDPGLPPGPEAPDPGDAATLTTTPVTAPTTTSPGSTSTIPPETTSTTSTGGPGTSAPGTTTPPGTATTSPTNTTTPVVTTGVPITTTTFGGSTTPHVQIDDETYPFTPDDCSIFDGTDAVVTGPGRDPDGEPVYVTLEVNYLRVDIGTDDPDQPTGEHWLAGAGSDGDLDVEVNNFVVTATGTFVSTPGGERRQATMRADCS